MDYYEYPLGNVFRATTPEHAAARVFGGKPSDYIVKRYVSQPGPTDVYGEWGEVYRIMYSSDTRTVVEFMGDIPILTDEEVKAHRRQGSL